ncbi:MAG: HutD family protein [Alphaproteobacteria bacterium]
MSVCKITPDDHIVMPWKNGEGTTRQIATGGNDPDTGDWGWRVSIAAVERDGAYSEFPGVDRLTTVVVGNGTDLFHPDGSTIALNPFQPTLIPSDVALWGFLRDEPIVNLNVMTRQGRYTATAEIMDGPQERTVETAPSGVLLVYGLGGKCSLQSDGGDTVAAAEGETLVIEGKGCSGFTLIIEARVANISIRHD